MNSRRFQVASEMSTNYRCDNCGVLISQVVWKRCGLCKAFDLCTVCGDIVYDELPELTLQKHRKLHPERGINGNSLQLVSIEEVDNDDSTTRDKRREAEYQRIVQQKKINNDYEMFMIMNKLVKDAPSKDDPVNSLIVQYHLRANQRNIRVLCLDGGGKIIGILINTIACLFVFSSGVRGYMPIKILTELITQKHLPHMSNFDANNKEHREIFHRVQPEFTRHFNYFVGTSTGGLIAFCLAIGYNILDMMEIYSKAKHYFKRNRLGPWIYSKYDPSVIHNKIDEIIGQIKFPGEKTISAEHATLLDIRNLLNPDRPITEEQAKSVVYTHGNFLEFADDINIENAESALANDDDLHRVPGEKVLLITAYNTTKNSIMIFNTSYSKHWGYRIADVLKSTMAAPTYFPPKEVFEGFQHNGYFLPGSASELFIDGGVFANDPELVALWVARMQWKKPANYHILSIGTGTYTASLSPKTWGGYFGWIFNDGFLVNTLMDATRSLTEIIAGNLAKFNNIRRMKLNYKIIEAMDLDDPNFVPVFDDEWKRLKNEEDFKAFRHFYDTQISDKV